jgi:RND superfamily putative drug exporter
MEPELMMMIEADHDLRNPTNMLILDRVARSVFHTPGIARVQRITRPLGSPIDHASIPFQISAQSGLNMFLSPDGRATRFMITHKGDPATAEGISHIDRIRQAADEAVKGTPLAAANIYLTGTASTYKDEHDGSIFDLMIAATASLRLIFMIMLAITGSVVASAVIVGTVTLSLGWSFGLSVLIWQHMLHMPLHWLVLAMAIIVMLAVGSDYNLLLAARFREEIGAGLKTGMIRSMGSTGGVVTTAGLVFAFTMGAMVTSDLRVVGQIGTTIMIGLLFDTLIVRSFMMPAAATLLGRWFWRPRQIRTHAAPRPARPSVHRRADASGGVRHHGAHPRTTLRRLRWRK